MEHEAKFSAVDPEYERRVRESFAGQGFMTHLGARLTELRPGYCEFSEVPRRTDPAARLTP